MNATSLIPRIAWLLLPMALGLAGCDSCRRTVDRDSATDGGGGGTDASELGDSGTDAGPCVAEDPEVTCDDGCSNDGDPWIDCDDFDCDDDPACIMADTVTIYQLQDPAERTAAGINENDIVTVVGVVVTAVEGPPGSTESFFIQEIGGAPEYSGIYVYSPSAGMFPVAEGDIIDITAEYSEFDGFNMGGDTISELSNAVAVMVVSSGNPLPAPVAIADPSTVATGGAMAEEYEGVLIEVMGVDVTAVNLGMAATTSFTVSGGLNVADELYAYPVPIVGDMFVSLTGPLTFNAFEQWLELLPRSVADFGLVPRITEIYPPASVVVSGGTVDLTVVLNSAAPTGGMDVCVESDVATVTVPGVVNIPAGMTSLPVTVTDTGTDVTTGGVAAVISATLSATCPPAGGPDVTADLWVDSAANVPVPTMLTPADQSIPSGSSLMLTVTLDVAPLGPAGASVLLSSTDPTVVSVPSDVLVAMGSTTANFMASALLPGGPETITAAIGANTAVTTLTSEGAANGLVISEVLYDVPSGDDGFEWIELYNGSGGIVDLTDHVIANGGGSYAVVFTFPASTMMPDGACWVIGGPTSDGSNFNPVYETGLDLNFTNDLQNSGTAADAVALFNNSALMGTPMDAVIYGPLGTPGGSNTAGLMDETGNTAMDNVDVGDAAASESIQRTGPTTWAINATPTPNDCSLIAP